MHARDFSFRSLLARPLLVKYDASRLFDLNKCSCVNGIPQNDFSGLKMTEWSEAAVLLWHRGRGGRPGIVQNSRYSAYRLGCMPSREVQIGRKVCNTPQMLKCDLGMALDDPVLSKRNASND